jgi:hypothetical protein
MRGRRWPAWRVPVQSKVEFSMNIPEDIRIPLTVFALQAAFLAGLSFVFIVLVPD